VVVAAPEVLVGVVVVVVDAAVVSPLVSAAVDPLSDAACVVDVVAFVPVADPAVLVDSTALDVVPGISAATAVAMPAVPTMAARVTAVVVLRIRPATNRRSVTLSALAVFFRAMAFLLSKPAGDVLLSM
jgi:hypothetical protein